MSGLFAASLFYGATMAGLAFLISLSLKKRLAGFLLVLVSVSLMTAIMLSLLASGMAQADFTFKMATPIFVLSAAIALGWSAILKLRALRNG